MNPVRAAEVAVKCAPGLDGISGDDLCKEL